jgi:aspartate carbamoyltransferase catalytic subunit
MPNLLCVSDLDAVTVEAILKKANYYQTHQLAHHQKSKHLANRIVTNLFFEPSTRTLNSFVLAESFHDMLILSPDLAMSSLVKGESIQDTLLTLQAMGTALLVIRHQDDSLIDNLKNWALPVPIINAGCGKLAHPTQALIDLCVILSRFPDLSALRVAIVGDIKHSRVARSQIQLLHLMGVREIRTVAPKALQATQSKILTQSFDTLEEGLNNVDVIIRLRLQKERLDKSLSAHAHNEVQKFCITQDTLKYAKKDAILLHPGPCIVGVDIAENVMKNSQTMILNQVNHSVAIRMACIDFSLGYL